MKVLDSLRSALGLPKAVYDGKFDSPAMRRLISIDVFANEGILGHSLEIGTLLPQGGSIGSIGVVTEPCESPLDSSRQCFLLCWCTVNLQSGGVLTLQNPLQSV